MQTITLTKKEIRILVRNTVREQIQAILDDPDFGLSLTPRAERRLRNASQTRAHRVYKSANEIIARLRLPI